MTEIEFLSTLILSGKVTDEMKELFLKRIIEVAKTTPNYTYSYLPYQYGIGGTGGAVTVPNLGGNVYGGTNSFTVPAGSTLTGNTTGYIKAL